MDRSIGSQVLEPGTKGNDLTKSNQVPCPPCGGSATFSHVPGVSTRDPMRWSIWAPYL